MIKPAAFVFASIIIFLYFPNLVFAQGEEKFSAKYNVTYTVFENGKTQVTENVQLINKTDDFRASEFTIELSLSNVENVNAFDGDGPINPKIEKADGKTKINLTFNQVVIGKDRVLPFTISFETQELAKKKGVIWEVNIPGVEKKNDIEDYNVSLTVPQSFGTPAYVKPGKKIENQRLFWTNQEIPKGGMVVAFGAFQIYKFNLRYNLKNPRLYPIKTEIAIPPDTNYQKIFITSVNPMPLDVELDPDGNWLAKYELNPNTKTTVNVTGVAQVFLTPIEKQVLGIVDRKKYLESNKYWEVSNNKIGQLTQNFKSARNIYDFVTSELTYDISRVEGRFERLGAVAALDNKTSAVCMEFTDLFIALSRAAGIPSREINGFAYTENSQFRPLSLVRDVLHAWPQYYDQEKETWIMVDPTWGNTTGGQDFFDLLDFNHIAFVIKGRSSEYPVPAGGYKITGEEQSRDVDVNFGENQDLKPEKNIGIEFVVPQKNSSFLKVQAKLIIKNSGNVLSPSQTFTISSNNLSPAYQEVKIKSIPPFGKEEVTINFKNSSLFNTRLAKIHIEGGSISRDYEILVSPFIFVSLQDIISNKTLFLIAGGGLLLGTIIIFFTIKTWGIYILRQKRQDFIRGEGEQPKKKGS